MPGRGGAPAAKAAVYAVILGSPARTVRNGDLAELLTFGLDHFARQPLVEAGTTYASASVPFEDDLRVPLVAAESVRKVIRLDRPLRRQVVAPLALDRRSRRASPSASSASRRPGEVVAEVPLVAGRDVEEPDLGERLSWYAGRALDEAGDLIAAVIPGI